MPIFPEKKDRLMRCRFLLSFILLVGFAQAQQNSFSLKTAIDMAIKQNLDIQIANTDLEIAKNNNNWGNAGALPTINANVSNTEAVSNIDQKLANGSSIQRNNVSNSSINSNLSISWRIYNGKRISATKERFEVIEKMGGIALDQQIGQIIFDVTNIYHNIIRLNKQITATKAIIALSEERYKIAETRFNVGSGAKTDMLQAEIDLNAQKVNLENINIQLQNTTASMNAMLKRKVEEDFVATEDEFNVPKIDFGNLVSVLDKQNYQLLMAQQERQNILNDRKIINAQRLPILSLNSNTLLNKQRSTAGFFLTNQTFGPNIGLGLAIPIFNGNINRTQLKSNSIQEKRQNLQIEQLRLSLQRDLLIAYQEYENAMKIIGIEESNVKLAEENNYISTERFKKLVSNSIELRQAQLSLIEAENRYINAQFRAQVAVTTLQFLSGEINKLL
jgi:outer membrane protein TolC